MAERYVVFDVETPNSYNNRMSSIGITVVERGQIVDSFYSLVNPEQHFNSFNIELTGISPADVADSPNFFELWQVIRPVMRSGVLVAHNAPFDMGVLAKCIRDYRILSDPYMEYACTCVMSRHAFPDTPNHKLDTLCSELDIELDHHNASSDSTAAAELLIHCMENGINPEDFIRTYDMVNMRTLR